MSKITNEPIITLIASVSISILAYKLTSLLVPLLGPNLILKGLGGYDMLKPGFRRELQEDQLLVGQVSKGPKIERTGIMLPEATGVIGASVYILLLSLFAPLPYLTHLIPPISLPSLFINGTLFNSISSSTSSIPLTAITSNLLEPSLTFPHHSFATYLASLLSLLTATFLGFLDDVFDIRWRFKVPIPVIASVPLLVTYAAGQGLTDIVLPKILGLRSWFGVESTGGLIHLGPLYYVYMSLLSTFCTNSINILAGVNGVEVGQALVIALSIILNDILYISLDLSIFFSDSEAHIYGFGLARGSAELSDRHLFSLYFMLPLIGICLGLLKHNWYPAKAFIGDTFCYFSGMAFAVVGILGHFSKTLLLFFLPQIFNFIYSFPQLCGIIPCPRHRLPRFNEKTGLLEPSYTNLTKKPKTLLRIILEILSSIKLIKLLKDKKGTIIGCSNLTILNLILVIAGPMKENNLTKTMLGVQAFGSAIAFGIRYGIAGAFYDGASRR